MNELPDITEDDVWADINSALLKHAALVATGNDVIRAYNLTVGRHREAIFRKFEYTEVLFFKLM